MKEWSNQLIISLITCSSLLLYSCSQEHKDRAIKADLTVKAKNLIDYAGVRFTVNNGIISLSGKCPTVHAKNTVESKAKDLYAVKGIISHIVVAPVIIGTDHQLKQGVDSILGKYPGVQAIVKDSIVQLLGEAKADDHEKLLSAVQKLHPKQLQNDVLFK